MSVIRVLFLSDTHLGYDLPFRPRIQRRRRGPEFFANFNRVLDEAIARGVDAVIHGGDLFYRSKVPQRLVEMVHVRPGPIGKDALIGVLGCALGRLPEDAIVNLNIHGRVSDDQLPVLRAESVRSLAPATMNVHVRLLA